MEFQLHGVAFLVAEIKTRSHWSLGFADVDGEWPCHGTGGKIWLAFCGFEGSRQKPQQRGQVPLRGHDRLVRHGLVYRDFRTRRDQYQPTVIAAPKVPHFFEVFVPAGGTVWRQAGPDHAPTYFDARRFGDRRPDRIHGQCAASSRANGDRWQGGKNQVKNTGAKHV